MTDDDTLPVRVARLHRLEDKYERTGELSDAEIEQVREDYRAVNESLQEALHPLVKAMADLQREMADAFEPLAGAAKHIEAEVKDTNDD